MSDAPHDVYQVRLRRHRAAAETLRTKESRISNARLAVFVAIVAIAFLALGSRWISPLWLIPPGVVFAVLLVWHDRAIRRRERADRGVAFYEDGIARLEHRFAGQGNGGETFRDPHHPYADDLDLFGAGSVFERLCAARTHAGEERLANWLCAPAPPGEVRARQEAVNELSERLDLREDLAILGEDVEASLHPAGLRRWGEAAPVAWSPLHRWVAPTLALLTLIGGAAWWSGAGLLPFAVALSVQMAYAGFLRNRVRGVIEHVDVPARDLALLSGLLSRLEAEVFHSPLLRELAQGLETSGVAPSKRIDQLVRLVGRLDARRNQLFAPVAALLLWTTQVALALEAWRVAVGPSLGPWIETVGTFEALASLARYRFEEPDHVFPELVEDGPLFEAESLGHPLIPPDSCVANDLSLAREPQALVVSGSNMSGKSTLLRAVGVATLLAQAGAPVCAKRMRLSSLRVGASIRIVDSLQEGASHFYAEIQRMHQVMQLAEEATGNTAALFLLDEIFHGTNSHDRGIGAEAVVRGLLERRAIGLVTTHDLALAGVADALAPRAANVHFEDHLDDEGRIAFDFRMRSGVVKKSNALALMRAVGLPV